MDLRSFEIQFELADSDSKVTGWFKIFESAAPAILPQTTLTVQQNFNRCAVVIEIYYIFVIFTTTLQRSMQYGSSR